MSEEINRAAEVPDGYCGHMLVEQRDGRGSQHVVWVSPTSTAAAYPPDGICDRSTWVSAEPLCAGKRATPERDAEQRRAGAAEELRDLADHLDGGPLPAELVNWLRERADRIEAKS